jgi:hypothetical protein
MVAPHAEKSLGNDSISWLHTLLPKTLNSHTNQARELMSLAFESRPLETIVEEEQYGVARELPAELWTLKLLLK